jgi:hypothetical protein
MWRSKLCRGYNQRERAPLSENSTRIVGEGRRSKREKKREKRRRPSRASKRKSEKSKPDVENAILGFLFVFSHGPCAIFACNVSSVRRADGYVHAKAREVGPVACEGFLHGRVLTGGMGQWMFRKCMGV